MLSLEKKGMFTGKDLSHFSGYYHLPIRLTHFLKSSQKVNSDTSVRLKEKEAALLLSRLQTRTRIYNIIRVFKVLIRKILISIPTTSSLINSDRSESLCSALQQILIC